MNLNKLFPRLSIRSKLAIAFALLAIVPLGILAILTARTTERHLQALARATLEHDLAVTQSQTETTLKNAERSVGYLAHSTLGAMLKTETEVGADEVRSDIADLLLFDSTLYQVKAIDENGRVRLVVRATGEVSEPPDTEAVGLYYSLRGAAGEPGKRLILPVELRDAASTDSLVTVPAIAIVIPIWLQDSSFQGVVVGEVYASVLFAGLDEASPSLSGVTGLIDADGLVLYHSAQKSDWTRLLGTPGEVDLEADLAPEVSDSIRTGAFGTITVSDRAIVGFRPLDPTIGSQTLMLYRVVPLEEFEASVARFRLSATVGAAIVLVLVLGLAVVAARQFTDPIYRLRNAAWSLARGGAARPLQVQSNDEFEDLANDFSTMAASLSEHRERLEELVQERTQELSEAHAKLADIMEYSADAIVGLDASSSIRLWNRGATALFGYTADEAAGTNIDTLLLPHDRELEAQASFIKREVDRSGSVINIQTNRAPKKGKPFPVSLTQSKITDSTGRLVGYSLIVRDTRLQREAEDQMRRSERIAAVSTMAAGLAHEFNNPLAIIANCVDYMEEAVHQRCSDCFLAPDLQVIREHVDRLNAVTQHLLGLARDDGEPRQAVALGDLLPKIVKLLEQTFASRDVTLRQKLQHELPLVGIGEAAIETVCFNLLLNAAEATPGGGVVTIEARRSTNASAVELEVTDTGPGIPKELRHKIFEPFFTTKTEQRGTGLGLAVCRSIVERQHGSIQVDGSWQRGSRFTVTLPTASSP